MDKAMIGIIIATGLVFGGILLIANRGDGGPPGQVAGETTLGEVVPIMGREHIQVGSAHPPYNSNPPTSGWHYAQPAQWGVHTEAVPDEQFIHNLEHGGVVITYRPGMSEEILQQLKALTDQYRVKVLLAPRPANDTPVALVAWGRILKLDQLDFEKARQFVERYRNQGPEQVLE